MSESRTELLSWVNDLTGLGVTKVEQCGTGAVYCQVMDSIYRDLPLSKVKFQAKHEYEYVTNYKVLQGAFDKHHIENAIPVERLIKCKFQDNIEFLQWMKKFWDQYYPGGVYEAGARRKAAPGGLSTGAPDTAPRKAMSTSSGSLHSGKAAAAAPSKIAPAPARAAPAGTTTTTKADIAEYVKAIAALNQQVMEVKAAAAQIEKEREFYFGKLRAIEVLVQQFMDAAPGAADGASAVKDIQAVLYQTEEGFELPADGGVAAA